MARLLGLMRWPANVSRPAAGLAIPIGVPRLHRKSAREARQTLQIDLRSDLPPRAAAKTVVDTEAARPSVPAVAVEPCRVGDGDFSDMLALLVERTAQIFRGFASKRHSALGRSGHINV